jgi:hypothetical protein
VARFLSLIPLPEPAAPVGMKRRSIGSEPLETPSTRLTSEKARATTPKSPKGLLQRTNRCWVFDSPVAKVNL